MSQRPGIVENRVRLTQYFHSWLTQINDEKTASRLNLPEINVGLSSVKIFHQVDSISSDSQQSVDELKDLGGWKSRIMVIDTRNMQRNIYTLQRRR